MIFGYDLTQRETHLYYLIPFSLNLFFIIYIYIGIWDFILKDNQDESSWWPCAPGGTRGGVFLVFFMALVWFL
jgi:hypothetical protein